MDPADALECRDSHREAPIHRLVLWNIDLTLVDVARVTRAAYADAFRAVAGRPLVQLPRMAGRTDSEIFFDALALNDDSAAAGQGGEELLSRFLEALAEAFSDRRDQLTEHGRLLPGARDAVAGVGRLPGVVQTVLTGAIRPTALEKLRAFGLEKFFDTAIGGYGSQVYPKGALLLNARSRASEKYDTDFSERSTVYIADSARDVEAARTGGARSIAVASGRSTAGELREAGADVVLDDLADTAAVTGTVDRLTLVTAD
ncbi:MAG: HAD family hydrolase [Actinobacteria bacterium]|nr:HAD family hydrolase [Actinomycetota bacterium]